MSKILYLIAVIMMLTSASASGNPSRHLGAAPIAKPKNNVWRIPNGGPQVQDPKYSAAKQLQEMEEQAKLNKMIIQILLSFMFIFTVLTCGSVVYLVIHKENQRRRTRGLEVVQSVPVGI